MVIPIRLFAQLPFPIVEWLAGLSRSVEASGFRRVRDKYQAAEVGYHTGCGGNTEGATILCPEIEARALHLEHNGLVVTCIMNKVLKVSCSSTVL